MTLVSERSSQALAADLDQAACELKTKLTPEQAQRLLAYVTLLQRWNAVHNLSASNDQRTLLSQHVVDCLAIVEPMAARVGRRGVRALDAGTGAGLPAAVLAIALPDWTVTAIDSVAKKVAFLRQVAGELRLTNLRPVHSRLAAYKIEPRCHVITSRAFASLRELVLQTQHLLLRPDGFWAAMKGHVPEEEIKQLPQDCQLFHVEPLAVPGVTGPRCLVWVKPTPAGTES
jgi:16S rRNA (guanine527-N7)-methyltransferase